MTRHTLQIWEALLLLLWNGDGGGGHGHLPPLFFWERRWVVAMTTHNHTPILASFRGLFCGSEKVAMTMSSPLLLRQDRGGGNDHRVPPLF